MDIAGDIGGTHTRVALFEAGSTDPAAIEVYSSRDHDGLEPMLQAFLAAHPAKVERAAFGVAGPVHDGYVQTTNLAWPVDGAGVARVLGLERVGLVNDLVANAWGIAELGPGDVATLNEGDPDVGGNAAVISAGTGLGEAGLFWDGARHHVFASEGGHVDFAPRSDVEVALRAHLAAIHPHVSYERVCSGMGLVAIHEFLSGRTADALSISRSALAGDDDTCVRALEVMVGIYGAEAGNLALKLLATGGVYVGGGIAPQILPRLQDGSFMRAFTAKGRFADLLARIPIYVILNDRTALLGAARFARGEPPGLHHDRAR
ncbi:MAG TPA: glucokinase [Gaiellales bacterium]|jgi:glucokinase